MLKLAIQKDKIEQCLTLMDQMKDNLIATEEAKHRLKLAPCCLTCDHARALGPEWMPAPFKICHGPTFTRPALVHINQICSGPCHYKASPVLDKQDSSAGL